PAPAIAPAAARGPPPAGACTTRRCRTGRQWRTGPMMTPTQRRRMLLVVLVVAAAAIALALVSAALQRNIAYLYTPSEVRAGKVAADARFRLGGMVSKDSFKRDSGALLARFEVTDGDAQLPVTYDKILPD